LPLQAARTLAARSNPTRAAIACHRHRARSCSVRRERRIRCRGASRRGYGRLYQIDAAPGPTGLTLLFTLKFSNHNRYVSQVLRGCRNGSSASL